MGQHLDHHIQRYIQGEIEHHDLLTGWDNAVALDEAAEQAARARLQETTTRLAAFGKAGWTTEEASHVLATSFGVLHEELEREWGAHMRAIDRLPGWWIPWLWVGITLLTLVVTFSVIFLHW